MSNNNIRVSNAEVKEILKDKIVKTLATKITEDREKTLLCLQMEPTHSGYCCNLKYSAISLVFLTAKYFEKEWKDLNITYDKKYFKTFLTSSFNPDELFEFVEYIGIIQRKIEVVIRKKGINNITQDEILNAGGVI